MAAKKSKLDVTQDEVTQQAFHKYQSLKQIVDLWQQERGSYWRNSLNLAEKPPYLPVRDLPAEAIIELWKRLNSSMKTEISDADLSEILAQFTADQNTIDLDPEMSTCFHMAVSGVAHLAAEMAHQKGVRAHKFRDGAVSSELQCPVCAEFSKLAVVTPPDGKRVMHCTICGFEWPVKRVGCLHCGSEDAKQQIYLQNEDFPGIEMVVCLLCGQYCKEINARELSVRDYVWEDLRTLPLNYAAELWSKEHAKKVH
ncbi:MAG: formate dehydrogenase accessory protein FdhE [Thermacetogeniaceae bacterium]|jgi:FdhE protein|nr:formate dehydrogenase accessory protein FdhE [Syntrophomonadaceae bacterium]